MTMGLILNPPETSLTEVMIHQKHAKMTGEPPTLMVQNDIGEDKEILDSVYTRILGANVQNNMCWTAHLQSGKRSLFPQCRKLLQDTIDTKCIFRHQKLP